MAGRLNRFITQKFLEINDLRWKDVVVIFSRMVVKRSWFDSLRPAGGPPGFAEIDQNYMDWLEEQVYTGRANADEVAKYKNMSFIERQNPQFKPINRAMLQEIAEGIESGKLGRKNGHTGGGVLPPEKAAKLHPDKTGGGTLDEEETT